MSRSAIPVPVLSSSSPFWRAQSFLWVRGSVAVGGRLCARLTPLDCFDTAIELEEQCLQALHLQKRLVLRRLHTGDALTHVMQKLRPSRLARCCFLFLDVVEGLGHEEQLGHPLWCKATVLRHLLPPIVYALAFVLDVLNISLLLRFFLLVVVALAQQTKSLLCPNSLHFRFQVRHCDRTKAVVIHLREGLENSVQRNSGALHSPLPPTIDLVPLRPQCLCALPDGFFDLRVLVHDNSQKHIEEHQINEHHELGHP
mmetsp:Transcript_16026/g.40711  ORF Transcript_16026/g.40711 Transcript_16026/m.40711 type:complete len:256 (-) Transcript_16026:1324-2091(-)